MPHDTGAKLLAIVNLSTDSFSGDGIADPSAAIARARAAMSAGAWMVDIGASSTRPGAVPRSAKEELRLLNPVLFVLSQEGIPFSVDTAHHSVMSRALALGAAMINDVRALQQPGALEAVAKSRALVCLMHTESSDLTTLHAPLPRHGWKEYMRIFFAERIAACTQAGITPDRIVLDPGFGFGKSDAQQHDLLHDLSFLSGFGLPILIGVSRKGWIRRRASVCHPNEGGNPETAVGNIVTASTEAAAQAALSGASILRVHDVAVTLAALAQYSYHRPSTFPRHEAA